MSAFDDAWNDHRGTVVLVEGSDLVRADIEGQLSTPGARQTLREQALRDTDRLVGRMLAPSRSPRRGGRGRPEAAGTGRRVDGRLGPGAGIGTAR